MITGQQLADAAIAKLPVADKEYPFLPKLQITYDQEDCQGFVKGSFKRAGKPMSRRYAGSNDMARNAMEKLYDLNTALKQNLAQPGWLAYMIEPGHNAKYDDEMGDATHVGIYVGTPGAEIVNSSASKGGVIASTFHRGHLWTHIGPAKEVLYTSSQGNEYGGQGGKIQVDTGTERLHQVIMPIGKEGQKVNFRAAPDSSSIVLEKIVDGTQLMAGDAFAKNGQLWKLAKSQGLNGYIVSSFLLDISASSEDLEPIVPPQEPSEQPSQPIISGTTEDRLERLEHAMSVMLGKNWRER